MLAQATIDKINPRQLFLVDGAGALLSAFLLGVVLVTFEEVFGMPRQVSYYLALAALSFAIYSISCYWTFPEQWSIYMWFIAIINLIYCLVTLVLMTFFHNELTMLGLAYFVSEIIVVVALSMIELKTANHSRLQISK